MLVIKNRILKWNCVIWVVKFLKSSCRGVNERLNLIIPMKVFFFLESDTSKNNQENRDLYGRITLYMVAQSVRKKKILSTTKIQL